jgi:hypothetical protein
MSVTAGLVGLVGIVVRLGFAVADEAVKAAPWHYSS